MNKLKSLFRKPVWILAIALLLIAALGMWMLKDATPYGLGLRTDSSQYINGARNLLAGDGYTRTSGGGELKPITHFPPMFSGLIAFVGLSGLEALRAARLLVILLYGGGAVLIGWLAYRLTKIPLIALAGAFLFAVSGTFLNVYAWVMSEPLFVFLWLAVFICLDLYWQHRKPWLLVLMGALCGVAYLTRYVGVLLFIACAAALFLAEGTWKQRLRSLGIMAATFLVPVLAWSIRNIIRIGSPTNRRLAFHPIGYDKIQEGLNSFWNWLLPDQWVPFYNQTPTLFAIIFYCLLAGGMVWLIIEAIRLLRAAGRKVGVSPVRVTLFAIALSPIIYIAMTLFSISFYDAATAFEHRILIPIYLSVMLLILVGLGWLYHRKGLAPRLIVGALLLAAAWVSYTQAKTQVYLLSRDGLGYANTTLRGSEVIDVIKSLPAELILYSNEPQLVYLVANRITYMTPVFFDSIAYEYRDTYQADLMTMREQIEADQALLVYFYEPDYATDAYYLELTEGLKPVGEYPFAFIFGPNN
jgi:hypothetical protein